ncbi:hypothetical protein GCM10010977_09040 [Citricoccus zhacaiensis]|uniref:VTC domain-containing protein n=1 Tax=Citricoccus zhacaiensis TaxID=489142 RepID=A0ABQ2LSJ2_9MICC|nr:VTC domain-containing protein [Citricoccus zhacaiensis]GGO42669.1 hypothetical protein GCM10010977_09040 [Citricoccus zhacaiensis]
MSDPFSAAVATLPTLDLESMNRQAALHLRHDRKYIVPVPVATDLVLWAGTGRAGVGQAMALEVAGTAASPYDSTYYDTPALEAYRMAARRHRHRFKVRTRRYPDTGDRFLEVKTKSASGQTVKHRIPGASRTGRWPARGSASWPSDSGGRSTVRCARSCTPTTGAPPCCCPASGPV